MKTKRYFIAVLSILATSLLSTAYAYTFPGGDGTPGNPYWIQTTTDFYNIRNYKTSSFILKNDLDFSSYGSWTPIGSYGSAGTGPYWTARFTGTFDGNNYTIKNISVSGTGADYSIFGAVYNATIKNLLVDGCSISSSTGTARAGIVIGDALASTFQNIGVTNSSCTATAGGCIGGIVGRMELQSTPSGMLGSTITNCYAIGNTLSITTNGAGGIVGAVDSNGGTITNCIASNSITGLGATSASLGGIAGYLTGSSSMAINCITIGGSISAPSSSATTQGRIVGQLNSSATLVGNAASDTIKVKGSVPTTNITATTINGANATGTNLTTPSYYNGLNFAIYMSSSPQVWRINPYIAPYPVFAWRNSFSGGTGTQADPYQITTIAQFDQIRYYRNQCFILKNDLDFTGYVFPSANNSTTWYPVGNYGNSSDDYEARFKGTFDGGGYKLKNLVSTDRTTTYDMSIFGATLGATIKNVLVEGCQFAGGGRVGTLTGETWSTTIQNVGVKNSAASSEGNDAGGITGPVRAYNSASCAISNCYSVGNSVSVFGIRAGGISAMVEANGGTISNCIASNIISATDAATANQVGGIAAYINTTGNAITNCVVAGGRLSLASANTGVGRIVNSGSPLSGNAASDTILVNGLVPTSNTTATAINGADATAADLATESFYTEKAYDLGDYTKTWRLEPSVAGYPLLSYDFYNSVKVNYKDVSGNTLKASRVQLSLTEGATYTATDDDKQSFSNNSNLYTYDAASTDNATVASNGSAFIDLVFNLSTVTSLKEPANGSYAAKTSDGKIIISNLSSGTRVALYNISGIRLEEQTAVGASTVFNAPGKGIYLLKISNGATVQCSKVLNQ